MKSGCWNWLTNWKRPGPGLAFRTAFGDDVGRPA
jgi:hypothetical protein